MWEILLTVGVLYFLNSAQASSGGSAAPSRAHAAPSKGYFKSDVVPDFMTGLVGTFGITTAWVNPDGQGFFIDDGGGGGLRQLAPFEAIMNAWVKEHHRRPTAMEYRQIQAQYNAQVVASGKGGIVSMAPPSNTTVNDVPSSLVVAPPSVGWVDPSISIGKQ